MPERIAFDMLTNGQGFRFIGGREYYRKVDAWTYANVVTGKEINMPTEFGKPSSREVMREVSADHE